MTNKVSIREWTSRSRSKHCLPSHCGLEKIIRYDNDGMNAAWGVVRTRADESWQMLRLVCEWLQIYCATLASSEIRFGINIKVTFNSIPLTWESLLKDGLGTSWGRSSCAFATVHDAQET